MCRERTIFLVYRLSFSYTSKKTKKQTENELFLLESSIKITIHKNSLINLHYHSKSRKRRKGKKGEFQDDTSESKFERSYSTKSKQCTTHERERRECETQVKREKNSIEEDQFINMMSNKRDRRILRLRRRVCVSKIVANVRAAILRWLRRERQAGTERRDARSSSTASSLVRARELVVLFRFEAILSVLFLVGRVDHHSILTRNAVLLRKHKPSSLRRAKPLRAHLGILVECLVATFEQVDLRVVQFRVRSFVDAAIFRSEVAKTKQRAQRERRRRRPARCAYSEGARSEENSQWKMRMFLFVGSVTWIGLRKNSS